MYIPLKRMSPEEAGFAPAALQAFAKKTHAQGLLPKGIMIAHGDKVVFETFWAPFGPEIPHQLNSLTKSFVAIAMGFAVEEGLLRVEDRVTDYLNLPEALAHRYKDLTIWHLLTMSTGHKTDINVRKLETAFLKEHWIGEVMDAQGDWIRSSLMDEPSTPPGERFYYCNRGPYLLAVILQRLIGTSLLDYLTPRLFEPLGIEAPQWDEDPPGMSRGGNGLCLPLEAVLRFGMLLLGEGVFQGKRILSPEWIREATGLQMQTDPSRKSQSDWAQGYGYYFWRCRHGAYRADGAFGQFCVVLPKQRLVVAAFSGRREQDNMQEFLDLLWETMLADTGINTQSCHAFTAEPTPRTNISLTGRKLSARYKVEYNWDNLREMTLRIDNTTVEIIWLDHTGENKLSAGMYAYRPIVLAGARAVAKGYWSMSDVFEVEIMYLETPYGAHLRFHFDADGFALTYHCRSFLVRTTQYRAALLNRI